jgi:hypothetical protein
MLVNLIVRMLSFLEGCITAFLMLNILLLPILLRFSPGLIARLMVFPMLLQNGLFSTDFGVFLIFVMTPKLLLMLVNLIWALCPCSFVASIHEFHD